MIILTDELDANGTGTPPPFLLNSNMQDYCTQVLPVKTPQKWLMLAHLPPPIPSPAIKVNRFPPTGPYSIRVKITSSKLIICWRLHPRSKYRKILHMDQLIVKHTVRIEQEETTTKRTHVRGMPQPLTLSSRQDITPCRARSITKLTYLRRSPLRRNALGRTTLFF